MEGRTAARNSRWPIRVARVGEIFDRLVDEGEDGGPVAGATLRERHGQEGSGRVRNRVRAPVNWSSQGQRRGKCRVRRRAERVSRPAREKNRRRRVLVVTTCSPRPIRAVQRARL